MSAQIIDGKATANKIQDNLAKEVADLKKKQCYPKLAVILVGEDPASQVYVRFKEKACEQVGIISETIKLPSDTKEKELLDLLDKLNADFSVHGILVQLPLPDQISDDKVLERVSPDKDVDGFHPINRGKLVAGQDTFLPCTPAGIMTLFQEYNIDPTGKHIVIVGRSNIVGKPFAIMMMQKKKWANATVTVCHTGSGDLTPYTRQADILVAAAGQARMITADMVKEGVIVIDVGVNRVEDSSAKRGYRLVGDVDFEAIKEKARAITPVPGGVGPMTIALLLKNTVHSARKFYKL